MIPASTTPSPRCPMSARRLGVLAALFGPLLLIALTVRGEEKAKDKETCPVLRVIDGDTIVVEIEGKQVKVRLIGVDTPETVHPTKKVEYFGREASAFTK